MNKDPSLFEQCAAISRVQVEQMQLVGQSYVAAIRSVLAGIPWESLSDGDLNQIDRLAYMLIHDVKAERAERRASAKLAAAKDRPAPTTTQSDPYADESNVRGSFGSTYTGD